MAHDGQTLKCQKLRLCCRTLSDCKGSRSMKPEELQSALQLMSPKGPNYLHNTQ